jgi:hypothetical protein
LWRGEKQAKLEARNFMSDLDFLPRFLIKQKAGGGLKGGETPL